MDGKDKNDNFFPIDQSSHTEFFMRFEWDDGRGVHCSMAAIIEIHWIIKSRVFVAVRMGRRQPTQK